MAHHAINEKDASSSCTHAPATNSNSSHCLLAEKPFTRRKAIALAGAAVAASFAFAASQALRPAPALAVESESVSFADADARFSATVEGLGTATMTFAYEVECLREGQMLTSVVVTLRPKGADGLYLDDAKLTLPFAMSPVFYGEFRQGTAEITLEGAAVSVECIQIEAILAASSVSYEGEGVLFEAHITDFGAPEHSLQYTVTATAPGKALVSVETTLQLKDAGGNPLYDFSLEADLGGMPLAAGESRSGSLNLPGAIISAECKGLSAEMLDASWSGEGIDHCCYSGRHAAQVVKASL